MRIMSGLFAGTPWERPVTCEHCGRPCDECGCPRNAAGDICRPQDQPARVRREKRGSGRTVTVVSGLDPAATDLKAMLTSFKSQFSAGGAVRADGIELQGDHRDAIVAALQRAGYPAKGSGG